MSVTLRLQGLSSRTRLHDIQKFFVDLSIAHGEVHIIGGPDGEVFVDVATWDIAYQALQMSGQNICDSVVQISVVTEEEKQKVLENCNKDTDSEHGRNGTREEKSCEKRNATPPRKCFYLRLDIYDSKPKPDDIRHFFDGLHIRDMVFSKHERSSKRVVVIMFDNRDDASEGYNRYKNSKILRVEWSSEKEWIKYGGKADNGDDDCVSSTSGKSRRRTRSRSPRRRSRSPRRRSRSPRRNTRSPRRHSRSPRRRTRSPRRHSRSPRRSTRSPRRHSSSSRYSRSSQRNTRSSPSSSRTPLRNSRSPPCQSQERDSTKPGEYHVRLMNLSYRAKREDIKKLFHNHVQDDHIVFVDGERGHRTREGFATFTNEEHFKKALRLDKVELKGHKLYISLISKSNMERLLSNKRHSSDNCQAYVYLRNFPPDITKSQVQEFFSGFSLNEEDIFLLFDKNNTCLGDVLVKFSSSEETSKAEKLDHAKFNDKRIPVKVVHEDKLTSFLHSHELHMMPVDMNECVTQEDNPSEDEVIQEDDAPDDEQDTQDVNAAADDCTLQKENPPECVSQEDD